MYSFGKLDEPNSDIVVTITLQFSMNLSSQAKIDATGFANWK